VSKNNGGPDRVETRTCNKSNKVGHIATYCPDKTEKTSNVSGTKKTEPAELPGRQRFLLRGSTLSLRISRSVTKMMKDENGKFARNASAKQQTKRDSFS
jgi:hypothetical protein